MTRRFLLGAFTSAVLLAVAGAATTAARAQTSYTVTDLGTLTKSNGSYPIALNSKDTTNIRVVGRTLSTTVAQGFFWSTKTGMLGIPAINLGNGPTYTTTPAAVNSQGEVVGKSAPSDSTAVNYRAIYWSVSRGIVNLDPYSTTGSTAAGINDAGVIVG